MARTSNRIPVGLLYSASGPYAAMGRGMLNGALLAVEEVNASDAFDFSLDAEIADPGGNAEAYHAAAARLIAEAGVEHIVGCYTSASRKQVLPLIERTDRLLWHPARYEGFESSENVIYVGAAPNQHVVPLARYMIQHLGAEVYCVGSNYIWTWETNRVLREITAAAGGRLLAERLIAFGDPDVAHLVADVMEKRPPVIFSTLVGETSYNFLRAFNAAAKRKGLAIPILSCSLCEPELALIGPEASLGHVASSAYFASLATPGNAAFVANYRRRFPDDGLPSVDTEASYVCVMLLARALRRAGTSAIGAVRKALFLDRFDAPQGPVWIDPSNNHCFVTPRLARSVHDASFEIFWEAPAPQRPDPYLAHLDLAEIARGDQRPEGRSRPPYLRLVSQ